MIKNDLQIEDCSCKDLKIYTPINIQNPPGLSALRYRVGTHSAFKTSMITSLLRCPTLSKITSRSDDDLTIGLFDAWATVADVITFYQERIANEGFLRTATERRSILELARAVGYELGSGVAASTFLAFTLEKALGAVEKTIIDTGTAVQSLPGQGEMPQVFETDERIEARPEWNDLRPRIIIPQSVNETTEKLYFEGTNTRLKPGDGLLFVQRVDDTYEPIAFKKISKIEIDGALQQTIIDIVDTGKITHFIDRTAEEISDTPKIITYMENLTVGTELTRSDLLTYAKQLGLRLGEFIKYANLHADKIIRDVDTEVYAFRVQTGLFGHNAPPYYALPQDYKTEIETEWGNKGKCIKEWDEKLVKINETSLLHPYDANTIYLDNTYKDITPYSWIVLKSRDKICAYWIYNTEEKTMADFLISAKVTGLKLPKKPLFVAHLKGALEADYQLQAIMEDITQFDWKVVTGDLTSSDLTDAVMLFMVKADSTLEYTDAELNEIKAWFDTGGKAIWVAADNDEGNNRLRQPTANAVLEKIGSALRIEACSAEDPVSNAGAPYRVLGDSENCDEEVEFLVAGVTKALFHGPAIITAYSAGRYYKLEEEKPAGVYVVMATSDTGLVVNNNPPDPEVHEVGDEGNFPLMAMELVSEKKNVVIATGDAPFDQYTGMYKPEIHNYQRYVEDYPQQGAKLFENILTYVIGSTLPEGSMLPELTLPELYLRETTAHVQSEKLVLAGLREKHLVQKDSIILDCLVEGLQEGQPVAITGEAVKGESEEERGITKSEIAIISDIKHIHTPPLCTKLTFTQKLENKYKRDTVTLNANVAGASHGETKEETLGGGDPSQRQQEFLLKQKPLTFVSATTATGAKSTLDIRVDDILCREAPSLYNLKPDEKGYMIRIEDDGQTRVIFGDGIRGARPRASTNNIKAKYRIGIGNSGMLKAGQLSLLMGRPLGVRSVTNPIEPTGAEDPEDRDSARANAPLTVLTLERVVSFKDVENFARGFQGISKAKAFMDWDGERRIIYLTAATVDGKYVEEASELFKNLCNQINASKDPAVIVCFKRFTHKKFDVEAEIKVAEDREFNAVKRAVDAALQEKFSFEKRQFGQAVTLSEVIATIQQVKGVVMVNIKHLAPVGEKGCADLIPEEITDILTINPDGVTLEERAS